VTTKYYFNAETILGKLFFYAESEDEFRSKLQAHGFTSPAASDLSLQELIDQVVEVNAGDVTIEVQPA
jgi:hypothetical protein